MQEIKALYKARDDAPCEKPWMKDFVKYLKQLRTEDWANSINDLPETEERDENGEMGDNVLLLWKEGNDFRANFFHRPDSRRLTLNRIWTHVTHA